MNIKNLVVQNNIKEADAIILRKKILGMVDHFAIFVGFRNGYPIFVANYKDGVKEVSNNEMQSILKTLRPTSIEKFEGNEIQRRQAVRRAMSRVGEKAYNYFENNCEHFKNWVHSGEHSSEQVNTAGNLALTVATGTAINAIINKNAKSGAIAVGMLLLGTFFKNVAKK